MTKPVISIISSLSENNVIGRDGNLIFKVSEDLKRFKNITMGHPIIMGRNTYLSINKPLPGRNNIVITSSEDFVAEGIIIVRSLAEAIKKAKTLDNTEIFIIGGGRVFRDVISLADKLYLTLFYKKVKGDTFFPDYSEFKKIVFREEHQDGDLKYEFIDLLRY